MLFFHRMALYVEELYIVSHRMKFGIAHYIYLLLCVAIVAFCAYYPQIQDAPKKDAFTENAAKYTAVIVEPRQHPALEFVLKNIGDNLSSEWRILVMHGTKNEEYVEKIVSDNARIQLHNLNVDNLAIKDYNKLLTSREFHEKIPTEIFLVFQTDSMICNSSEVKIEDYLKYDYVGAPLSHMNGFVGNGGFSLRRKSKMLEVLEKCPYNGTDPEDVYFATACKRVSIAKPSQEEAALFSNEGILTDYSFGVHKPWGWGINAKKSETCPGLMELSRLNLQT